MWREQSKAYRYRMGFRQEDLAEVLLVSKEAVVDHERRDKTAHPPVDRAAEYAQRMLVSLDWMGGTSQQMWAAETLRPLRSHIRNYITEHRAELEGLTLDQRMCTLLRETYRFKPEQFTPLLLSGVAQLVSGQKIKAERREWAMTVMTSIIDGATVELPDVTPDYLADFWQVSAPWLLDAKGDPILVDVSPYLSSIRLLEENGLLGFDYVTQNINVLRELYNAWRINSQQAIDEE